ncbi:MAG TPA: class I SAM-dependent methyltransferase [Actinomycetota bacterium]|jgi:SAM-dependent methyltransferase|nr:class I SAM-dependent methyltransferase [Actinomycetota bacterium]
MTPKSSSGPSSGSVSFDWAAGFYDSSRTLSPEGEARATELLGAEVAGRGRCLEIGVGTGRVALPLHRAGLPMAGVDISPKMVDRLVEKAGGRPPFPLALADATALPFGDGTFGAALAAHVFHLIPPWRQGVVELARVVRPGGVVLVDLTRGGGQLFLDVRDRFAAAAGLERVHVGLMDFAELDSFFASLGATSRDLPSYEERGQGSLEGQIASLERGDFSYTWRLDDETRRRAAGEVRAWARATYGSLARVRATSSVIAWRAYDLPDAGPGARGA